MSERILVDSYIKELELEYASTRKCLERIPVTLFDYKPHPTSMAMGYLTLLVAEIPLWITFMVEQGEVDFATYKRFEFTTSQELVDHFDEVFNGAKKSLASITDADLNAPFYLKREGQVLFTQPRHEGIGSTINHWVHHRGQLTVYMRLNGIAVPSIYGPSADDRTF
ncbi:MAG: damage-inducible protein DinB [Dyadobacter sp. 50-39]|uniref:DinB family protein n=1 Tax=Dyadobacter sp. 50-39 TaxID=1895756 RepID=UPI000967D95D|nr:DinB family protein [Dyadobacter sp. 50-39]OJV21800.1 MAG: damage-inducible protein DinB [Dyadobacter sp. 50-39]